MSSAISASTTVRRKSLALSIVSAGRRVVSFSTRLAESLDCWRPMLSVHSSRACCLCAHDLFHNESGFRLVFEGSSVAMYTYTHLTFRFARIPDFMGRARASLAFDCFDRWVSEVSMMELFLQQTCAS